MPEVQKVIAETLRMWPAPPLLIRCATEAVTWPEGGTGIDGGAKLARANDLFISMYTTGRSKLRALPHFLRALPAHRRVRPFRTQVQHGSVAAALGGP